MTALLDDGDVDVLQVNDSLPQFPNQSELIEDAHMIVDRVRSDAATGKKAAARKPGNAANRAAAAVSPRRVGSLPVPQPPSVAAPSLLATVPTNEDDGVFGIGDDDDVDSSSAVQSPAAVTPQAPLVIDPQASPQLTPSLTDTTDDVLTPDITVLLLAKYCHARGMKVYCRDVAHVLAPVLTLQLPVNITYAVLYKLCHTLFPRLHYWYAAQSHRETASLFRAADDRLYGLIRRVLQLQHGELVDHLDTVRPDWAGSAYDARKATLSAVRASPRATAATATTTLTTTTCRGCIPAQWTSLLFASVLRPSLLMRLWTALLIHQPVLQEIAMQASQPDSLAVQAFSRTSVIAAVILSQSTRLLAYQKLDYHSSGRASAMSDGGGSEGQSTPRSLSTSGHSHGFDFVAVALDNAASSFFSQFDVDDGAQVSVSRAIGDAMSTWVTELASPSLCYTILEAEIDTVYRMGEAYKAVVTASSSMRKAIGASSTSSTSLHAPALKNGSASATVGPAAATGTPSATNHDSRASEHRQHSKMDEFIERAKRKIAAVVNDKDGDDHNGSGTRSAKLSTIAALRACQMIVRTWAHARQRDLLMLQGPATADAGADVDVVGSSRETSIVNETASTVSSNSDAKAGGNWLDKAKSALMANVAKPAPHITSAAYVASESGVTSAAPLQPVAVTVKAVSTSVPGRHSLITPSKPSSGDATTPAPSSASSTSNLLSKLSVGFQKAANRLSLPASEVKPVNDTGDRRTTLFSWGRKKATDPEPPSHLPTPPASSRPAVSTTTPSASTAATSTLDTPPHAAFAIGDDSDEDTASPKTRAKVHATASPAAAIAALQLAGMTKGAEWDITANSTRAAVSALAGGSIDCLCRHPLF